MLAKDHQRQLFSLPQNFQIANKYLNLTRGDFGVDQAFIAQHDIAINADTPFAAQLFNFRKDGAVRIRHHLRDAIMIAQIDKQQSTMITHAVHPA